ncbi:hypothetical protein ACN28G_04680 [Micromonospora sp. WMMA1923]|uniref:hypothetical protein n=1 Tax=Micromonospora sp. WMMA1923 TaxID=3404125 RepID=UPI003B926B9C
MAPSTDQEWLDFVRHYLADHRAGRIRVRDEKVVMDRAAHPDVRDNLRRWTNITRREYGGPMAMPERIRAQLVRDGVLPEWLDRVAMAGELTPLGYRNAMAQLAQRCHEQGGRLPARTDTVEVTVFTARRLPGWTRLKAEEQPFDIGRRLRDLDRQAHVSDTVLTTLAEHGWSALLRPGSAAHRRLAWLQSYEPALPNRRNPETYLPGPARPLTYRPREVPAYDGTPGPPAYPPPPPYPGPPPELTAAMAAVNLSPPATPAAGSSASANSAPPAQPASWHRSNRSGRAPGP